MLPGVVFSAVTGGSLGLLASVLSGHPPVVTLLSYSLAGCCGVLAFLCQALSVGQRARRA